MLALARKNRELKMQREISGRVGIHPTINIANEMVKAPICPLRFVILD
jgi:hypothetical protein